MNLVATCLRVRVDHSVEADQTLLVVLLAFAAMLAVAILGRIDR